MKNTQQKSIKRYAKVVLIVSCVFAVISSILFVAMIYDLPQIIKGRAATKYLYENGFGVEAHIESYFTSHAVNQYGTKYAGRFHIVYEYIDEENHVYKDEYTDTFTCKTKEDWNEREQYIKQMIADGTTMKMLIADNGLCCLSIYKESLIGYKNLALSISVISVSSVVLGLSIFGIVRQSKTLRSLSKFK